MQKVTVKASRCYDILIGSGLISTLGQEMKQFPKVKNVCVVSETNVWPLHGAAAVKSLEDAGYRVVSFVFPSGEENKNGQTYLELVNFLAESRLTRSDMVVALGGGVVGDLAGFAAATFLRGVQLVQVPTTVLSAVDSSVGGKTAIDLPAGKNLAGAFCQPSLVLCDTDALNTLPEDIFREGCAEAIKYGVLYDPELFTYLSETGLNFDRERVIRRCVELKGSAVMEDEFDTGSRMRLNLGHTIGHGIEARSHFAVSHGKAVAIGMAMISRAAAKKGMLAPEEAEKVVATIAAFGLPTGTEYPADEILSFMLSDKKRSGGTIPLIIPTAIGNCEIVPTPVEKLKDIIEAGM